MPPNTLGPSTADSLREIVAGIVGTTAADIAGDANLVFLGLGSLELMRLVTRWRREGLAIEFSELAAEPTIDAWAAYLDRTRGAD
ncbi:hypothetical protein GCM10022243_14870 [Saccharothrix violaceirubra]|uniref:Aryl carrier-like protein n=1 Tax=Saccharothrix violaceirubra TaxID=413306 RepID=A0A7W7T6Q4_9PSEU|nr:phosphopantetheine-binding protein [Saccharothrix violaceirubra]MBB4967361.1 aryl carrier-like protein [Saccharothrix violaceirubra]